MSIAEFYVDNGIDPWDPDHTDHICGLANDEPYDSDDMDNGNDILAEVFGITIGPTSRGHDSVIVATHDFHDYLGGLMRGHPNGRFTYSLSDIPNPSENELWSALCADNQWKYKAMQSDEQLYFCQIENCDSTNDYWGERTTLKAVPAPGSMHQGALAPKWVFETEATKIHEEAEKSLEQYMRRLICAVTGRFVIIQRPDARGEETLTSTNGVPCMAVKYRYRYWDNDGHVYDTVIAKCRQTLKWDMRGFTERNIDWQELIEECMLPGDFSLNTGMQLWMRYQPGEKSLINDSEFWDNIYAWRHDGTTYCSEWDQRLTALAEQAGVPSDNLIKMWPLDESKLDAEASTKGWTKLTCQQPALASYRKDDVRLNFYLSTGTVGSCLDHPTKGKTQLFRRYMENPMSLFDNPREHTGKGYYTKNEGSVSGQKRKAQHGESRTRSCASCKQDQPIDQFSKNQQRKGQNARCKSCVQATT